MIGVTPRARRQIAELRFYYERELRLDAARNLNQAIQEAARRIEGDPAAGLPAPRPYPTLARPGQAWIKAGPYRVRYSLTTPAITAVFHERADIPGRV